jgi:hypothetical protein
MEIKYKIVDQKIEEFLTDLKKPDPTWEKCACDDYITFWRKMDEQTGIYMLKFIGRLPYIPEIVEKVLFDNKLRPSWDTVIEDIKEIQQLDNERVILHILVKSPSFSGVSNRDLVHIRTSREIICNPKTGEKGKLVVDISDTETTIPEKEGYVRAQTLMSAGILEPTMIPNLQTKTLQNATLYSMISHVDIKGYVPKAIVNMVSTYSTIEWFKALNKACEMYVKGELKSKNES